MGDDTGTTTATGWDQSEELPGSSAPLGAIALALAVIGLLCAPTYFFSVFTYLSALPSLLVGALALGEPSSRGLGTGALVVAVVACVVATVTLVSVG